jgi:DNA adenine methylase
VRLAREATFVWGSFMATGAAQATEMIRPPLRWAGSKRKLLRDLEIYWTRQSRYLEAFAGSACLFFRLRPKVALLNDTNAELIHALEVMREHPRLLHDSLMHMQPSPDTYYFLRAQQPTNLDPFDRAVRFFYLNRYCFNGIYRTNAKGEFNVPYSPARTGGFPSLSEWVAAAQELKNAELHCQDFDSFVRKNARQGDFIYLDPPYAVSNRRVFRQYSAQSFGIDDLRRLSDLLIHLDRIGAVFVVSYAASPEAEEIGSGWKVVRTRVQRNIAGFAEKRKMDTEVVITNMSGD